MCPHKRGLSRNFSCFYKMDSCTPDEGRNRMDFQFTQVPQKHREQKVTDF